MSGSSADSHVVVTCNHVYDEIHGGDVLPSWMPDAVYDTNNDYIHKTMEAKMKKKK